MASLGASRRNADGTFGGASVLYVAETSASLTTRGNASRFGFRARSRKDDKVNWYENGCEWHDPTPEPSPSPTTPEPTTLCASSDFVLHEIADLAGCFAATGADVDGDGSVDVVAGSSDAMVYWYSNDGSESFSAANDVSSVEHVPSIFAIDVDWPGG